MTLVKFNQKPFEKTFNSLFEDLFQHFPVNGNNRDLNPGNFSYVPVNINETNDAYQLEVVAPGFDKADFKINVDQTILTISAEKKAVEKNENEKKVRKEYSYKSFNRSFTLDEKINSADIQAKYDNGILYITLPKKEEVKVSPKEISVQ